MVGICADMAQRRSLRREAYQLLDRARSSLAQQAFIECGCCLREAVRIYLHDECTHHGCLPKEKPGIYRTPPRVLAKRLTKKGVLGPKLGQWIGEIIEMSNKAAHLSFVPPRELEAGIVMTKFFLDGTHLIPTKTGGQA
ncbi:hypothetical protein PLANPX_3254 [Lacipirellula parvula]|uniref:DUF4145 domain-containing protein n=2 Tax=Lacipirellula parvula TaxID=2650471 RepID=A0A5K7XCF0_9BACT|nr:hypothetical protein PLANPX_3254 [Lacipirellula parvula]